MFQAQCRENHEAVGAAAGRYSQRSDNGPPDPDRSVAVVVSGFGRVRSLTGMTRIPAGIIPGTISGILFFGKRKRRKKKQTKNDCHYLWHKDTSM